MDITGYLASAKPRTGLGNGTACLKNKMQRRLQCVSSQLIGPH